MYIVQFIYFQILRFISPVVDLIGKIHVPASSKEKLFEQYYNIESLLREGDVILTKSDGHLSNLINFGYWKHALIVTSGERFKQQIVEAIGEGVVKKSFIQMLSSKDRIVVLRPTDKLIKSSGQIKKAIEFALAQVGKPYDMEFDSFTQSSQKSFYCSELVYSSIKAGNPDADFELRPTFGIQTVSPSDLYKMASKGKFEIIIEVKG